MLKKLLLTCSLMVGMAGTAAVANYAATQGAGTNFGSIVIGGVHFASQLICDATVANQCAAVTSGGALQATIVNINSNGQAGNAGSAPVVIANTQVVATGGAVPAQAFYQGVNVNGNLVGVVGDPCQTTVKTNLAISQATSTTIITGSPSKKTYICSMALVVGAAEIVNLTEGTGTVCGSGTAVVMGSTTAANGLSFATNGGISLGNGGYTVAGATNANQDNVCLTQSVGSRVSGVIQYVQQ